MILVEFQLLLESECFIVDDDNGIFVICNCI